MGYSLQTEKGARAHGRALRISTKNAVAVCRAINGKSVKKSKMLLENLVSRKTSLNRKFYTNACKEILRILKNAESNAKFKGSDAGRMVVRASAHKGFSFRRPRSRRKFAGQRAKITNVQIVLTK